MFTRNKLNSISLVIFALPLMVACGGAGGATAEAVAKKCGKDSSSLDLSEDKKSIEFLFYAGTESQEDIYNCLLKETGAPSSVDYRVKETRPIDGTQDASWDGWQMYWNYEGKGKGTRFHFTRV